MAALCFGRRGGESVTARLKKHWRYPVAIGVIGYLYLIYRWEVPCLFRKATGLPCPGCGMTRAVLSLLQLPPDIPAALRFNPMVFLLPLFFWLFLTGGRPRGSERLGNTLLITSTLLCAVWYACRLIAFLAGFGGPL